MHYSNCMTFVTRYSQYCVWTFLNKIEDVNHLLWPFLDTQSCTITDLLVLRQDKQGAAVEGSE